jgi:hypothetical protein
MPFRSRFALQYQLQNVARSDRPRTFEEVKAAQDPDEIARLENGESYVGPVVEDRPVAEVYVHADRYRAGEWRVEYFDDDDCPYVTIFAGPSAEQRAGDYYQAIKAGGLKTVRAWPPKH